MAQNGFNRRSCSATRTYPGTAARLTTMHSNSRGVAGGHSAGSSTLAMAPNSTSTTSPTPPTLPARPSPGSVPTMFVRPLSRSQLAPVHIGAGPGGGSNSSPGQGASLLSPSPIPSISILNSRPISLDQPRPTSERHGNVYLGAPVSHHGSGSGASGGGGGGGSVGGGTSGSTISQGNISSNSGKVRLESKITAAEQVRLPTNSRTSKKGSHSDTSSHVSVVTAQPTKRNLLKDKDESSSSSESGKVKLAESSITCPYCRKCRCEACATPRPLPSRWICSKSIHCGPEPLLDYVTCLCCVKAVFYHCGKNHEPDGGVMCADKPCSCAPHRKFWRWGCMAAMSVMLPCLCLYWPCRGCIGLAEKAYQKYHNNGCTCHRSSDSFGSSASPSSRAEATAGTDLSEDEDQHNNLNHLHHLRSPSRYSHPPVVASRTGSEKQFLPL